MPSQPRTTRPRVMSCCITSRAWLIGIEKPIPCPAATIAVLIPITLPSMFRSGPPELPGLIEASVWMKLSYCVTPTRVRPLADAELVGVTQLGRRQGGGRVDLEHGEIGLRVATDEPRRELPLIRQTHDDFLSVLDHVVVRQDVPLRIHHDARTGGARVLTRAPAEVALVELL